jgi:hypothetical protein
MVYSTLYSFSFSRYVCSQLCRKITAACLCLAGWLEEYRVMCGEGGFPVYGGHPVCGGSEDYDIYYIVGFCSTLKWILLTSTCMLLMFVLWES